MTGNTSRDELMIEGIRKSRDRVSDGWQDERSASRQKLNALYRIQLAADTRRSGIDSPDNIRDQRTRNSVTVILLGLRQFPSKSVSLYLHSSPQALRQRRQILVPLTHPAPCTPCGSHFFSFSLSSVKINRCIGYNDTAISTGATMNVTCSEPVCELAVFDSVTTGMSQFNAAAEWYFLSVECNLKTICCVATAQVDTTPTIVPAVESWCTLP